MRLFFAIELPDDVRLELGRLRPPAGAPAGAPAGRAYRWVKPELLHVTLAFLGEQPPDALPGLRSTASEVTSASRARRPSPGRLWLGTPGSFGPPAAARVLWVGLGGDLAPLLHLREGLMRGLRAAGFAHEERPFAPHVTLARRRTSAPPDVAPPWPPARPIPRLPIPFETLALMQSELGRDGPRYTPLERFRLG